MDRSLTALGRELCARQHFQFSKVPAAGFVAEDCNREYFEMGVGDMAQAESEYPGWLSKLLTDPVKGLENYGELFQKLTSPNGAIKIYCEVA